MRTGLFVLLVCAVFVCGVPKTSPVTAGQSINVGASGNELILAYQAVQKADSLGAPSDQVAPLSTQLNAALGYYNTAIELASEGNITQSQLFSSMSNNASNIVLTEALALQGETENRNTNERLVAYTSAIIASMISAVLVLEYHRIPNFFRKRRLFNTKLEEGNSNEPQN